ncbi:putative secretion protein Bus5, partial [Vibrio parahaemolyticus VPTS-2010_2]
PSNAI